MADPDLYAVLAEFESPGALLRAVRRIQGQGFGDIDAFSPYPVDGMPAALGLHDRRVPAAALIGGVLGLVAGFGMQVATNLDYPLWIGGRPLVAPPAFTVTTLVIGIFAAVAAAVGTMLFANRLPRLHHPLFAADHFARVTDDGFFLAIFADVGFDRDEAGAALAELDPVAIIDVPAEPLR